MSSIATVVSTFKSIKELLNPAQKLRAGFIYVGATFIAFADIIGLSSMIPVLMLAIDHSFLEKSRKLQAIYHYFEFDSEGFFLKILILFIIVFFLLKSVAAIALNRYIRKTAIEITKNLSSKSFDYAFRHNSYEKVAADGLGFNDLVIFTPYYFVSGVFLPFITLITESAVVFMLILVFTIYKPILFFLIAGLLGTAFFAVNRYTRNKITKLGEQGSKDRDKALHDLNFGISGFTDVKAHGVENFFKNRFLNDYNGFVSNGIKAVNYQLIPARVNEFVALLGIVFLVIYGYFYSGDNLGHVRVLAALFAISVFRLIPAANRLLQSLMHLKLNSYTLEKLKPVIHSKTRILNKLETFTKTIALNNIGFSHNHGTHPVFQNLNLEIKKGEIIGISGPSGSGKTTLAKILLGFYQPTVGDIVIDDKATAIDDERLNLFSYMGQESFILNGTVRENVALGIPPADVDGKKVTESLQMAAFHISGISNPEDHIVGDNGAMLSEGQKQRLVLARELYRNVAIYILDEPTSALDTQTEDEVMISLKAMKDAGKTMIIIAHRNKIFELCNSVYSIENHQLKKIK